jgi:hypothetical protein
MLSGVPTPDESATHNPFNLLGGLSHFIMLPHVERKPAHRFETVVRGLVSLAIHTKLVTPPFSIVLWQDAMSWAGVPEAAVDKYRDFGSSKIYIWLSR